MPRIRIQTNLEKSANGGALIVTDLTNREPQFLNPGTNGQVLQMVAGAPAWGNASVGNWTLQEFQPTAAATTVTLSNTPVAGTLEVFRNGLRCRSNEFSLSGTTITFTQAFGASAGGEYSEEVAVRYRF